MNRGERSYQILRTRFVPEYALSATPSRLNAAAVQLHQMPRDGETRAQTGVRVRRFNRIANLTRDLYSLADWQRRD